VTARDLLDADDLGDRVRDDLRRVERLRWFLTLGWVVALLWLLPAFVAAVR
jgi:hypothetical protein